MNRVTSSYQRNFKHRVVMNSQLWCYGVILVKRFLIVGNLLFFKPLYFPPVFNQQFFCHQILDYSWMSIIVYNILITETSEKIRDI